MSFDYDNLLNRVLVTDANDNTTGYTLESNGTNQYSIVGSENLSYDYNGNLIQKGTWHYLYDCENQMIANYNLTGEPNEVSVSLYSYDDFGRRIAMASATGVEAEESHLSETYLYDGFQVIGEYDGNGELVCRFVYGSGIDEVVAMYEVPAGEYYDYSDFLPIAASWLCTSQDAGYDAEADLNSNGVVDANDLENFVSNFYLTRKNNTYYTNIYTYVYDGLGSVTAVINADPNSPAIAERYYYDEFGKVSIYDPNNTQLTNSAIGNPYLFTARRYDSESGLYYYRYRMYSPQLGRFIQTDPIGYYDSMNLYQYCINNPVNWVDPWGLMFNDNPYLIQESIERARKSHFNRNNFNKNLPRNVSEAIARDWKPIKAAVYHQQGVGNEHNQKWVSPNGKCEIIFDESGQKTINDSVNMGTFNYSSPSNWLGHFGNDMVPYYLWGNVPDDPTTFIERLTAGYKGDINED